MLIGTSIVSSTRSIGEDDTSYTQILEAEETSKELLFRGNYGYAYHAYPGPEGTIYFPLDDLGVIFECGDTISGDFLYGGTIDNDGIWYATQYGNGILFGIDTNNGCEMWSIGDGGYGGFSELAWDDCTYALYGINDEFFFEIDPETGEVDYIGNLDVSLSQIEFDNSDTLYGFNFPDTNKMYTIDIFTLEATFVCNLTNITNGYYSVAFDKDTNNLYLLGGSPLYECNAETGECTLIGEMGSELTSFVIPYGDDDTTPPVTTHSLDSPEPDGNNGWYVSDVNVTLTATDDISGVKEIRYTINGGPEEVIPGDNGSFILDEDGDDILIEYYSIDYAENVEQVKSFMVDIDQTEPILNIAYEYHYDINLGHFFTFTTMAVDEMSGMDYVEFYRDNQLMKTVYGPGPEYVWDCEYSNITHIKGVICKREITDEYVKFTAFFIITNESTGVNSIIDTYGYDEAGNVGWDEFLGYLGPGPFRKILLLKSITLPNNYTGYIGRFFIFATFYTG